MRDDRGRFVAGPDKDRHQFTDEERSRGWKTAFEDMILNRPWLLLWLRDRVKATAKGRRK